ncbi:hypothetical protein BG015_001784 [Linnemannia schmuckeri]|uniref:Uncharacterized protein n=1 Tax=Linnemannia schmuckeri TaxID=64567 RepID=A0A9P5RPC1_9FUNG|nr:hypothetical protein BG015_001784 [Linnemannia schmuckeri]
MFSSVDRVHDDDEQFSRHSPFNDAFPLRLKSMAAVFRTSSETEWKHEWHASGQCEKAVEVYLSRPRHLDSLYLSRVQIIPGCLTKLAVHFEKLQRLEIEFCNEISIPSQPWHVDSGFFQYDPAGRPQFFAVVPNSSQSLAATAAALGVVPDGFDAAVAAAALEVLPEAAPRCCILNDEMAAALSMFHGLKSLILRQSDLDDSKVSHFGFFRLLDRMPLLECLSLTGVDIGDDMRWGTLTSMDIGSSSGDVGPGEVEYSRLKCVRLVGTHLALSVAQIFYKALPNLLTYDTSQVDEATCSDRVLVTMIKNGCSERLLSVRLALDNVESQPPAMSMPFSDLKTSSSNSSESDYGSTNSGWGYVNYEEDDPYGDSVTWSKLTNPVLNYFLVFIPRIECLDLNFVPLDDHSLLLIAISCIQLKTLRTAHCKDVTQRGVGHILTLCYFLVHLHFEHLPNLECIFWEQLVPGRERDVYEPWACANVLIHLGVVHCPLRNQHWERPEMTSFIRRLIADLTSLAVLELVGCMQFNMPNLAPTNPDTGTSLTNGNGNGVSMTGDETMVAIPLQFTICPWNYLPKVMPTLWRLKWQLGKKFTLDIQMMEQFVRVQCPNIKRWSMNVSNWNEIYWALRREMHPVDFEC